MTITGTIVYQDLEGGFWGIQGDDGARYQPLESLPKSVQREGQRVEAEIEPANSVSFRMWGRNVRVVSIKAL